jgi:hypothetical protein
MQKMQGAGEAFVLQCHLVQAKLVSPDLLEKPRREILVLTAQHQFFITKAENHHLP